jgi:hypothetical protein
MPEEAKVLENFLFECVKVLSSGWEMKPTIGNPLGNPKTWKNPEKP